MRTVWNTLARHYVLHQKHGGEYRLRYAGMVGFIGYPLFYVLYTTVMPQPYDSLGVRLVATVLCLFLALKDYWPERLQPFYLGYSYLTILYCLPFFHTYMVLMNGGNLVFTSDSLMAVFFTVLLVDWRNLTLMYVIGSLGGVGVYLLNSPVNMIPVAYLERLPTFILVVVGGSLFKHSYNLIEEEKRKIGGQIAHEVRNALNAINYHAWSVKRVLDDAQSLSDSKRAQIRESTENILKSTKGSRRIVDTILTGITDGPIDRRSFEKLSAANCVQAALAAYDFQTAEERHVKVEIASDFLFEGDAELFLGVFFNLLKNALYYLPSHPDMTVSIRVSAGENANLIEFKDTGPGIPGHVIPKLFENFATFGKEGGTGLGLRFCRRVMRAFGGDIAVRSVEGEYSRFILSFPKIDTLADGSVDIAPGDQNGTVLQGKRILVVDDSELNRQVAKSCLVSAGAGVTEASNGIEALELVQTGDFDLIVMDVQMPKLSGLDACRQLRCGLFPDSGQSFGYRKLPVIICTSGRYKDEALACGVDAFLEKPLTPDRLLEAVRRLVKTPDDDEVRSILGGTRILVVDDAEINRLLVAAGLRDAGAVVVEAGGGAAALDLLSDGGFDLVLLDMQMPGMDGYETSRRIRSLGITSRGERSAPEGIPVIALTAEHLDKQLRTQLSESGVSDYLFKDGDLDVVYFKLCQWLRPAHTEIFDAEYSCASPGSERAHKCGNVSPLLLNSISESLQRAFGDAVWQKTIALFLDELNATLHTLENAFHNKELARFEAGCHRLKGIAATVGAESLYQMAEWLDDEAKQGFFPKDANWKHRLDDICLDTKRALGLSPDCDGC